MTTHKIVKNGVTIEIEQNADQYGQLNVVARLGNQSQYGTIPGHTGTLYPRIEFRFCPNAQWLHKLADSRSWSVDDYETDDEIERRPTDNCEFVLAPDEVKFLNGWRVLKTSPKPAAHERQSMDISSGFGIGGHGSDDHNMRIEQSGTGTSYDYTGCNCNHGTRYDEACARCGRVTEICNNCERCENCHGK